MISILHKYKYKRIISLACYICSVIEKRTSSVFHNTRFLDYAHIILKIIIMKQIMDFFALYL